MKLVERLDFGRFTKVERTPQGGMRVPANVTRVGVFAYTLDDGGTRRELRHPDEVFAEDSLATLAGAPVTDLHPAKPVRPSNWRKLSVGHVGEDVKPDGDFVAAKLMIQDAEEIAAVERGDRKELSCGYSCKLDETPGVHNGEHYDAIQRDIRYNHVALGPEGWGRAGNEVALRLDSNGNQLAADDPSSKTTEDQTMKVIRIDGVEYEVGSDAHINKLEELHAAALGKETKRADEAEGKLAAETKRADEAEGKLVEANDPKRLDALVAGRVKLVTNARRVLGAEEKLDGKTDREIMIATIQHDDSDFDAEGKSDDFVCAYFEASTKSTRRHDEGGDGIGAARSAARSARADDKKTGGRKDSDDGEADRFDAGAARLRMLKTNRDAANEPLRFTAK